MKFLIVLMTCLLITGSASAQSTAQQVLPGYLTINGCPSTPLTPCYKYSTNPVNSAAGEASHVFLNKPGTLYGFSVTSGASAGYVLIYNLTAAPVDGAVTPVACYALPASQTIGVAFTPLPLNMTVGITAVFSTTGCFSQTSSATAFFTAQIL